MASTKDALRRQKRRELDARRSKSRIRLGSCLESWGKLKKTLGFSLHSELAQYLLDSHVSNKNSKFSDGKGMSSAPFFTTAASLQQLVLLVHSHSQQCAFPPSLRPGADPNSATQTEPTASMQDVPTIHADPKASIHADPKASIHANPKASIHADPKASIHADPKASIHADPMASMQTVLNSATQTGPKGPLKPDPIVSMQTHPKTPAQVQICLKYGCEGGHVFTWCPMQLEMEVEQIQGGERQRMGEQEDAAPSGHKSIKVRKETKTNKTGYLSEHIGCRVRGTIGSTAKSVTAENTTGYKDKEQPEEPEVIMPNSSGEDEGPEQELGSQEGRDAVLAVLPPNTAPGSSEMDTDDCENVGSPVDGKKNISAVPNSSKRGRQRRLDVPEKNKANNFRTVRRKKDRQQSVKDDMSQICNKRKRKATPKLILPCEFDGCWKIFSSRQYLNHHMKYQHFQQKTFTCSHPSCGKSFNFKKHLKEHEKLHSDQKDYICEFCARAFRTSSNLIIHRRIHTGEKPLQCEVCGFTCRQKASLNWHMRKHDAERSYQFPCEICGRRFEKRDNVTAHRSKSHAENLTLSTDPHNLKPTGQEGDVISAPKP